MLFDKKWNKKLKTDLPKLEPWQEFLLKTADEIEKRGWCTNYRLHEETGKVCFIGAMAFASGAKNFRDVYNFHPNNSKIVEFAYKKFGRFVRTDPINWNDTRCTNEQEMLRKIRECAKA